MDQKQAHADRTFTTYTPTQSATYDAHRPPYPSPLLEYILLQHQVGQAQRAPSTVTAGTDVTADRYPAILANDTVLLDVGCGPGTSTRSFAPFFTYVHGCDPAEAMITTARARPDTPGNVTYHVCSASDIVSIPHADLRPGSVDMITAAMSAHWFDLPSFYRGAVKLLKPGGTLAMWTRSSLYAHPRSTPRHAEVQRILFGLERGALAAFETQGNRVSREMYDGLVLPWECEPRNPGFVNDGGHFVRREWNREGSLKVSPGVREDELHEKAEKVRELDARIIESLYERESLEELARSLGTASMVTRWREANCDRVEAGEIEDCVDRMVGELRGVLDGQEWLELGTGAVVLILRKR